jgi:hypothetical protein
VRECEYVYASVVRNLILRVLERANGVFVNAVAYAYRNARAQFHPALFVLLYAGMISALMAATLWALSLVMSPAMSVNWELSGFFAGPLAVGELVRGHVRLWLRGPVDKWSPVASGAGGAAAGVTFWGLQLAKWGARGWYEPLAYTAFGTAAFLVLGGLIQYQARKEASQAKDRQGGDGLF